MKEKIVFSENLKSLGIFLAVLWHSAIAYNAIHTPWIIVDPEQSVWLTPIKMTSRSFFWGLLFLVAGYTVPSVYQLCGYKRYMRRLVRRFAIPSLVTTLTIVPYVYYIEYCVKSPKYVMSFWEYYYDRFLTLKGFSFGHTWLLINLMILLGLYTTLTEATDDAVRDIDIKRLNNRHIFAFGLGLFFITQCVSLAYPANDWIWFHTLEPYHLPQYFSLFFIGIFSRKRGWLNTLDKNNGYLWLAIGIILFLVNAIIAIYGIHPSAWFRPLWFAFSCTSFCVGLFVIFREHFHKTNRFFHALSKNAMAVYLVHVLFVVLFQYYMLELSWNPLTKFSIALVASYTLSNIVALILRKTPYINRFL